MSHDGLDILGTVILATIALLCLLALFAGTTCHLSIKIESTPDPTPTIGNRA